MRYAIMAVALLPLLRRCRREHLGTMTLIASVTGTLHFGLLYCGIARVDASTSAIIYQLATPFTLVLACVALGEVLKLKVVAGIALAFAGVLVLLFNSAAIGSLPGMLLVALAALAFATGSVLTKRLGPLDPLALTAWTAVIAAPQLLLWSYVQEHDLWSRVLVASSQAWWAMLYTALSGGLLGFGLWFWLLSRNSIQQLSSYLLSVPLFAIGVSQLLLGDGFTPRLLLGGALTLLGVALCQLRLPQFRGLARTARMGAGAADERR